MASSNRTRKGLNRTVTHEGGKAIIHDAKTQLERSIMACLLWENTFYESGESIEERIAKLSSAVKPEELLDIMTRAKEDMHLRHAPLQLLVNAFKRGDSMRDAGICLSRVLDNLVTRADDMTELLSLYWKNGKKPLPAQMKKGYQKAFLKFDAYQLAKYNRDEAIKLRDVLFLSHPKPTSPEQEALFKQLANNELPIPNTWEVRISACGKDNAKKKAVWEDLLANGPLGQLAFLRNLRNMIQLGVDYRLINKYFLAQKSWNRISPFQFLTAYNAAPEYTKQLEDAMLKSCMGVDKLNGTTLLLLDTSGSMDDKLSEKSEVSRLDTAIGLGIVLRESCEMLDIGLYAQNHAMIPVYRGMALRDLIKHPDMRSQLGYSTMTGQAIKNLTSYKTYDRVIVVTDEQSHDNIPQPKGKGYIINVGTYEPSIAYGAWTSITGWSNNIIKYIAKNER